VSRQGIVFPVEVIIGLFRIFGHPGAFLPSKRRWEATMVHPGTPTAEVVLIDEEKDALER
jgi:hypothetical protein